MLTRSGDSDSCFPENKRSGQSSLFFKIYDASSGSWVFTHCDARTKNCRVCNDVNSKKVGVVSTKEIGEMDGPYYSNKAHNELSGKAAFDNLRIYDRALSEEQIKALYEWEKIPSNPQ